MTYEELANLLTEVQKLPRARAAPKLRRVSPNLDPFHLKRHLGTASFGSEDCVSIPVKILIDTRAPQIVELYSPISIPLQTEVRVLFEDQIIIGTIEFCHRFFTKVMSPQPTRFALRLRATLGPVEVAQLLAVG